MGFLSDAAQRIKQHIAMRDTNWQFLAELAYKHERKRAERDEADRWLRGNEFWPTGVPVEVTRRQIEEGSHPCPHVLICARLDDYRSPEGRIVWREAWSYPSADLLMYQDHFGPYDPTLSSRPPNSPLGWEGVLQVALSTQGRTLFVVIPLRTRAWLEP